MSSFVGRFPPPRGYSEKEILTNREVVPNYRFSKYLGFSLDRIHNLDRTKAKINHSGCINIVKWDQQGHGFITGSDDRELKYWSITNDVEEVILKHSVRTRHRSNIFYADFDRVDSNIYYSCAADGSLRSSHALERNVGELLRSSDDIIHMFHIDQDQPKVIYTAEEVGSIFRIDLRTGHSDKIFQHTKHAYKACQRNNVFQMIPTWSSQENSVKAVIQNHTYSTPHLIVGGQGFVVGLLDLRLASYPEMRNVDAGDATAPAVSSFVKLWCPMFPMNTNNRDYQNIYENYKHSSLSHPYGTSTNDPLVEGEFKLSYRRHASARTYQSASTSGLDISKDGRRLLVSYQGDQIYTFDFDDQSNNNCIGCRAYMGGHCNYATFLKSVHFFGPKDEYVVAGSDTGHMWIWSSSPKYISGVSTAGSHVPRQLVTCPVWNILKADSRTCNGVAPHPSELLLISYGIDSSAKLWAVRNLDTGDNKVEEIITLASGRKISTDPSTYPLCRHDGPHDRSRYSRISVSKVLSSKTKSQFCALAMLPYLLEETKKNMDMAFPEFLNSPTKKNMVQFCSDYVSTAMLLRKCATAMLFNPSNATVNGPQHQYFKDDRGSFMPSDSLHDFFRTGIPLKDLSDYIFGTVKKWPAWSNKPNAFWHRLLRRYSIINMFRTTSMIELSVDYYLYLHYRGLDNNRRKLFNFFFLPVLALARLAEDAKNNGSCAFRNKDYEYAHHFYCKAQRYIEYILSLCLVPSLSSLSVKDNVPMEVLSQWTKEKRMKQIPKAMYDIDIPNPVEPQADPLSSAPILSRKLRSRLTRQLQAMGVPLDNDFFRRGARSGADSSASDSSVSDSVGSASTLPSMARLNERGEEIASSIFPGTGQRLSPIQEDIAILPSDASATSWTTVTETNVSAAEGESSRPHDDVSQSMASSIQGTVTSTSMVHGTEDDDEDNDDDEDDDDEEDDEDEDDDDDEDGDSELGLLRSGELGFGEEDDIEDEDEGSSDFRRASRFSEQMEALAHRTSSAKASKTKGKKVEGMGGEETVGSDIDDNALEGNVVRFLLPALSSCPVFIKNHKKELYNMQRFARINRRYWRKVTLHPHGPNRLVRGVVSPFSSADNSDNDCEMCISRSSHDEDEDENNDRHDPHDQPAAAEQANVTPVPPIASSPLEGESAVPPIDTAAAAESASVTGKKTVDVAPNKVGCNSPLCCCCGTKGAYPSPELKDLLSVNPVFSDDAEMDALILADDCSHWLDQPFVYDPVWRKHQRVNLKSLAASTVKGEETVDLSDNCDADDEGEEDRKQGRQQEGDIPDQKRRRLGSPSSGLQQASSSLLSTQAESAASAVSPNTSKDNDRRPLVIDNASAAAVAATTDTIAANNPTSASSSDTSATCSSAKDDDGKFDREFLSEISRDYLNAIQVHKATGTDEVNNNITNDVEEVHFDKTEDFFAWELSPQLARHLHEQAYALMKYVYDEHLVSLMLTVYSNLAATFIAMEKFTDARHVCEDAFRFARILDLPAHQIDAKLYFRRAVCYVHLHMYEEAVKDLQEAAALQPKDALIAHKLKEAKRLHDNKRKTEIRAYSRMFGDSSSSK